LLRRALIAALCFGIWLGLPAKLRAANFEIKPITLSLTPSRTSDVLTVENRADSPLRIQFAAFSWSEDQNGVSQLKPTDDLVVFPPLTEVPPHSDALIRIGSVTPFSVIEKPYRLFATELPPAASSQPAQGKSVNVQVVVLNKVSMPVFLQPARIVYGGALSQPSLQNGKLSFQTQNASGNVHIVTAYQVQGYDAANAMVYSADPKGGYVLAGNSLNGTVDIPAAACRKIRKLRIRVYVTKPAGWLNIKQDELNAELNVSPQECGAVTGAAVSKK
jgi:fimbrial chaperone protein